MKESGILSSPNPKPGRSLDPDIAATVKNFYCSDDVSRIMPGLKDFVTVRINSTKEHIQKRLVLNNLAEVYAYFRQCHPGVKVGFSKFASLRSKHCVLVGASGTHNICLCALHQNVKLLIDGCNLKKLMEGQDVDLPTYHHYLANMMCSLPKWSAGSINVMNVQA